jgi:hypothetical protein
VATEVIVVTAAPEAKADAVTAVATEVAVVAAAAAIVVIAVAAAIADNATITDSLNPKRSIKKCYSQRRPNSAECRKAV